MDATLRAVTATHWTIIRIANDNTKECLFRLSYWRDRYRDKIWESLLLHCLKILCLKPLRKYQARSVSVIQSCNSACTRQTNSSLRIRTVEMRMLITKTRRFQVSFLPDIFSCIGFNFDESPSSTTCTMFSVDVSR